MHANTHTHTHTHISFIKTVFLLRSSLAEWFRCGLQSQTTCVPGLDLSFISLETLGKVISNISGYLFYLKCMMRIIVEPISRWLLENYTQREDWLRLDGHGVNIS